jgi:hypothetical protein
VALGVPGRLRPRIFSTFGTTKVIGSRPNAPASFTPGEILGIHFPRLSQSQGTCFCRKEPRKKSQVTPPGIDPTLTDECTKYCNRESGSLKRKVTAAYVRRRQISTALKSHYGSFRVMTPCHQSRGTPVSSLGGRCFIFGPRDRFS